MRVKSSKLIRVQNNLSNQIKSTGYSNYTAYIFLFIATMLLYGWTFSFGWGLDDITFVYNSIMHIDKNWSGIQTLLFHKYGQYDYRPVTLISFWVEYKFFGDIIPGKSHLINVFIYALLIIQIFRCIVIADFMNTKEKSFTLALLAAFFFLIHPVHVGVVANIKSRDNLLSMLFGITSFIQFILYFKDFKWYRLFWIMGLTILAMFSKADAYVFWLAGLVYYVMYKFDYSRISFRNLKIPILVMVIVIITFFITNLISSEFVFSNDKIVRVYNDSPLFENDTLLNKFSFMLTTLLYYLKFMLIPHGYYFYFGYNQIPLQTLFSLQNIISFFTYLVIFLACIKWYKKEKLYLFSFLFYMFSIAYAANFFIVVSGILMDRYSFIASLGFILGISALLVNLLHTSNWKVIYDKRLLLIYVLFITATIYRTSAWKNIETLFTRDINDLKNSAHANAVIAGYYINTALFNNLDMETAIRKMKLAENYVDKSLAINSNNKFALESKGMCRTYFNDDMTAIPFLKNAIKSDSNYTGSYNNLGIAYRNISNIDSALFFFGIAMNKENAFSFPANNYIQMLLKQNKINSIDSTLQILQKRFPYDVNLNHKIYAWNTNRIWD